ncbi:6-pyruvoyl trahydropterin synthase family protein [Adlercreutzia sp. ZJ141]|uniref:6-pyruvoyl trahydropterin synthase family protein n=1 Tax=Adlercreutzia sp. ZJ141 TaxID=2709406 RepID=UPI0013EA1433|nr:6-carboxytetrahydropterin synthase [Adlercreutzia sp. ZJ141]
MYGLKTEYCFDAAHFLTEYYGKCENLHGHRWRVVAFIEQAALQTEGTMRDMVVDFGVFKRDFRAIVDEFDHTFLVEEGSLAPQTMECLHAEGFSLTVVPWRTTAENLAAHFARRLQDAGYPVSRVEVYETPNNCAYWTASS